MNGIKYAMLAGIATLLCTGITSCGNDDEDVVPAEEVTTPKTVSVAFGASASLGLGQIAEGIYSENPFIAEVDAQGIVTGKHVGSTVVHNGNQTVNVTVTGTVNLFPEPVTAWGATMDEVKKQHALGGWLRTGSWTYDYGTASALWYADCSDVVRYARYEMWGDSNTLEDCYLYIPTSAVDFQTLFKQFSERYILSKTWTGDFTCYKFINGYTEEEEATVAIYLYENILIQTSSSAGLIGGRYHHINYTDPNYWNIDEGDEGNEEETTPSQTQANMLKHAAQRARTLNILPE